MIYRNLCDFRLPAAMFLKIFMKYIAIFDPKFCDLLQKSLVTLEINGLFPPPL